MSKVEQATKWMEATANDNAHGYDQNFRWGEKGDYDCSAAVITAWDKAGVPVKKKGATYTGNLRSAFLACGFKDVTSKINKTNGSGLVRGDVLLAEGKHVAMYCGNGKEVEASINEKGSARGGKPGDQTGKEFLIRSYRNYPWTHILRYPEETASTATKMSVDEAVDKVISGFFGSGAKRVEAIKAIGLDPVEVQKKVNEKLSGNKKTTNYVVIAHQLYIRKGPGKHHEAIGVLKKDQKLQNDGTTASDGVKTWYKVTVTGTSTTGWVSGEWIKKA